MSRKTERKHFRSFKYGRVIHDILENLNYITWITQREVPPEWGIQFTNYRFIYYLIFTYLFTYPYCIAVVFFSVVVCHSLLRTVFWLLIFKPMPSALVTHKGNFFVAVDESGNSSELLMHLEKSLFYTLFPPDFT